MNYMNSIIVLDSITVLVITIVSVP